MATLLNLSPEPGEIDGWGLVDADTARELAADGEWRRWLVEPETGRLLDVGSATYRPTAALDRYVRARDRTCRFPNCNRPAVQCDLDHWRAFHTEGGSTTEDNLTTLCRRHHNLKHHTGWAYQPRPGGGAVWTSPSGNTYQQLAEIIEEIDWTDPDPPPGEPTTSPDGSTRPTAGPADRPTAVREPDPWLTPSTDECPF